MRLFSAGQFVERENGEGGDEDGQVIAAPEEEGRREDVVEVVDYCLLDVGGGVAGHDYCGSSLKKRHTLPIRTDSDPFRMSDHVILAPAKHLISKPIIINRNNLDFLTRSR